MKRILLIEDEGFIKKQIIDLLRNNKHEVKHAINCTGAVGFWRKYDGQFDCVILDLNINPQGLTDEETLKYFPVHGILVLNKLRDVPISNPEGKPQDQSEKEIWEKTFVYSAHIDQLKNIKCDFPHYNELKLYRKEKSSSFIDLIERVSNY